MIFRNARCILPDGIHDDIDVVVKEGKIAELRPQTRSSADSDDVDLSGNYLAPGFVDVHVHGALGHDTMEALPDAFRAICQYHVSGGTTSLCLTTATAPIAAITNVLQAVERSRPGLPQIAGVHVEGPFISPLKRGAQREQDIQEPTDEAVGQLLQHSRIIRRLTIAPEIRGALPAIDKFVAAGVSVSAGHSNATDDEARAGFKHGVRSVTHTFNCMSSMHRDRVYRRAGLLEFALSEPQIVCELIADGHHVLPTLMKMLYRAKGAGGIALVTDATAGAGLPEGKHFSLAGVDCVVENGVCLLADRTALAGSASRMIELVRTMVHQVGVPLHEVVTMATRTPARLVGLTNKGEIRPAADADLVVLSPQLEVVQTIVGGESVFSA